MLKFSPRDSFLSLAQETISLATVVIFLSSIRSEVTMKFQYYSSISSRIKSIRCMARSSLLSERTMPT